MYYINIHIYIFLLQINKLTIEENINVKRSNVALRSSTNGKQCRNQKIVAKKCKKDQHEQVCYLP